MLPCRISTGFSTGPLPPGRNFSCEKKCFIFIRPLPILFEKYRLLLSRKTYLFRSPGREFLFLADVPPHCNMLSRRCYHPIKRSSLIVAITTFSSSGMIPMRGIARISTTSSCRHHISPAHHIHTQSVDHQIHLFESVGFQQSYDTICIPDSRYLRRGYD